MFAIHQYRLIQAFSAIAATGLALAVGPGTPAAAHVVHGVSISADDKTLEERYQEIIASYPQLAKSVDSGMLTKAQVVERFGKAVGAEPEQPAKRGGGPMTRLGRTNGAFDFNGRIDLSALGQNGITIDLKGTAESQFVLDGFATLATTLINNQQSVGFMAWRSDTSQYYSVNLDPNQTAIGYMAGDFTGKNDLTLTDPIVGMTAKIRFKDDGGESVSILLPPTQAEFMTYELTPAERSSGDLLKKLLSTPIKPARVNTAAASLNPGENYSPKHRELQKFAGDFRSEDGVVLTSRMVGEGRYLLSYASAPTKAISFMAYNTAGGFFQQMVVSPQFPAPIYLQGNQQADGSIALADPFNPNGLKSTVTFRPGGGYETVTTMGGQVIQKQVMKPAGS